MAGNKGVFMKNNVDKFHCDNMTIRDQYNRQRIFRGINICIKKNNRKALKGLLPILDDKFFKLLNKCGINIIRLGLTWEIIEPEEGFFDREVIDIFKKFAYKCRENNIYIFWICIRICFPYIAVSLPATAHRNGRLTKA